MGIIRELNEDCFRLSLIGLEPLAGPPLSVADLSSDVVARTVLFGVYDGCGGAGPGDIASVLASETVHRHFGGAQPRMRDLERELAAALDAAGRAVFERARSDYSVRGMGTTATVGALDGQYLRLAHVGDSRAYLLRGGRLTQLTEDDTLVRDMLKSGALTLDEVAGFDHQNVITRALGLTESVPVSSSSLPLEDDDRLLLCTDGIWRMIDDSEILVLLRGAATPREACAALIAAAEVAGGHDNETLIVADVRIR